MREQQESDDDERADVRRVVPIGLTVAAIIGGLIGMAVEFGTTTPGWRAMVVTVTTMVGGGAALVMMGRVLQGAVCGAFGRLQRRVEHDDEVISMMGQDIERDEQRQAADLERARLEGMAEAIIASEDERKSLLEAELERVRAESRETFRLAIEAVLSHPQMRRDPEAMRALYWQIYADVLEDLSGS